MTQHKNDTETRYSAEAEFHNRTYSEHSRHVTDKYYRVIASSSDFYRRFLELHSPGKRVLEYGCGENSFAVLMSKRGASVSAIDIAEVAIEDSRARALREGVDTIDFRVMNAEKLEFPSGSFDIICGTAILHHLELDTAMREIARTLAPGGVAIFREPLAHNPIINLYRWLTPSLRTEDEHPLRMSELTSFNRYFGKTENTYFHLFSLLSVPFLGTRAGGAILRMMDRFDRWIFGHIAPFRRYAWTVALVLSEPKSQQGLAKALST